MAAGRRLAAIVAEQLALPANARPERALFHADLHADNPLRCSNRSLPRVAQ